MFLAQTTEMVSSGARLIEQGGILGVMMALTVVAIVVLYRLVVSPLLESIATITGSVREITVANKDTAEVLRGMIDELRPHLPDRKNA
jgi:ferric-dicitrate binding protein FerR (iron transport regulator)